MKTAEVEELSMPEDRVQVAVLVIGSLGELAKKLIETEARIPDEYKDRSLLLEAASLRKILEEWPVLDKDHACVLFDSMRLSVAKLLATEKELEELVKKDSKPGHLYWIKNNVSNWLKYRNEVRKQIAELNKLSGGIGKASALPEDAEIAFVKEQ